MILDIQTPRWAIPLLDPCRYKGGKGGRSSGKSHFFGEMLIEEHIANPDQQSVCIREIQKSLKFSAKKLIEDKIRKLGVSHLFDITLNEIRSIGGQGIIIFQGMQDHTADSIKSLEGFDRAWVEEAQSMSFRSLELLIPTIRNDGSEIWFTWNPDQETDAVDQFFLDNEDAACVHVNYIDNPWCPKVMRKEAERVMKTDYDSYAHVWLGGYNSKSEDQVLSGKWRADEFEPEEDWDGPYFGADWGFSTDPNTLIECHINDNTLYIYREAYGLGVEIDDTPEFFANLPGSKTHTVRADNARPEIISYMQKHGYPRIVSVDKWPGSVEDGVSKLRSFDEIVIHTQCPETITEARLWKYKRDRKSDDILPVLIDKNNHCWDAIRYALAPLIKNDPMTELLKLAMGQR